MAAEWLNKTERKLIHIPEIHVVVCADCGAQCMEYEGAIDHYPECKPHRASVVWPVTSEEWDAFFMGVEI
jgi:hypothetical protein